MMIKKVVVIGAGASGLTAIKTSLESGLDVTCYEQSDDVAGLWKYREEVQEGMAGCMRGTYMNCSKEMTAFSDFPPPEEFPNFMPHDYVYRYLSSYADHFDLKRHIRFHKQLTSLKQTEDYSQSGRWTLKIKDLKTGKVEEETHDAVMVCAGHHVFPYIPEIKGIEDFRGLKMHSHEYKKPDCLEDKRVAVIGLGNSGADIAVEASHVAKKVYLISRKGGWIHPRMGKYGEPFDAEYYRRSVILRKSLKPLESIFNEAEKDLNFKFDHALYNLKPNHRVYNQYTIINDELPIRILNGTVTPKITISRLTETGIILENDSEVYEIDVLIYATGYKHFYSFLDEELIDMNNCPLEIYRFVFPIRLAHSTLSFVGLIDPEGSVFTVSEIQARWIVQVWTGQAKLPSTERMLYTGCKTAKLLKKWGNVSSRHQTRIFWFFYMERIASYINARPNFLKLLFTDPMLFWACATGPCLAYQYRIQGPFRWLGSRTAIMSYEERMRRPLTGKTVLKPPEENKGRLFGKIMVTTSLGLAVMCMGWMVRAKTTVVL